MAAVGNKMAAGLVQVARPDAAAQVEDPSTKTQALAGDQSALQELILTCNQDGMDALRAGKQDQAFEQFKYAEAMLLASQDDNNMSLLSVTCNNLGCYYKKVGKFHGALSYLRRALKMEVELDTDMVTVAGTHLNLCAVLSKLEKHEKAVQHALCALELMSNRITFAEHEVTTDDHVVLAIAYHNVAMEREFLQQWDQAATCFQTGYQASRRLLGEHHPLSVTLGNNCEAALKKARINAKVIRRTAAVEEPEEPVAATPDPLAGLPQIPTSAAALDMQQSPMRSTNSVRAEANDWMRSEEAQWANFAAATLGSAADRSTPATPTTGARDLTLASPLSQGERSLPPLKCGERTLAALEEMKNFSFPMPRAYDMGIFRLDGPAPRGKIMKQTALTQALEDHPEALMDLIDAEGVGNHAIGTSANDFRPNRSMKRSTRTSRMVRRTGVFNETSNRDRVTQDKINKLQMREGGQMSSLATQTIAAERIQNVWRHWRKYCQQNSEWMTVTWICATMIQSHWRSYHVRRKRLDATAITLQRHFRGVLVRNVLKKHTAAVTIQRRAIGMITREKLRRLHVAATHIQRMTRGALTRKRFRAWKSWKLGVIITLQRLLRVYIAKGITNRLRTERRQREIYITSIINMQRFFRGWKGRQRCAEVRELHRTQQGFRRAATKIQSLYRYSRASKRVHHLRDDRVAEMGQAVTVIRKVWIGRRMRRSYLDLKAEHKSMEASIITVQRYMRGCMCRLKMWREVVRQEEEQWGANFIQCVWRGYLGRVRWESAYEDMWRREMAAAMLARNLRGWLARLKVRRAKRVIARREFEHARARFRAAQRLQALVRGVQVRKVTSVNYARARMAAVAIQRIARGRALRVRLWNQIAEHKAVTIQAAARRFLVRSRAVHLAAKVVVIQRAWRRWLRLPPSLRAARAAKAEARKAGASRIQQCFREFSSRKAIKRIKAGGLPALAS